MFMVVGYFSVESFIQQFGEDNQHLAVKEGKNSTTWIAAWFVSNCYTHSGRDDFTRELKKYIAVDIYGACGDLKCQDEKGDCMVMINSTYKVGLWGIIIIIENNIPVLPLSRECSLQGLHHRKVL